jgi:cystathionine beta-lyase/cystathionine gamma-synthase
LAAAEALVHAEVAAKGEDVTPRHPETIVVQPQAPPAVVNTPVIEPIYQGSAWSFASLAEAEAIFSGKTIGIPHRSNGTPNHRLLESLLAELEDAEACVTTAGGMSALALVFWTLLEPGARVVASRDLFGVTAALLGELERWGVLTSYVDTCDLDAVEHELRERAHLIVAESISNPRMRVPDLDALADLAQEHGALFAVDNTLAGPYHCRPLRFGADLVIESATKALAGHHDVVLGAVAGRNALIKPMRTLADRAGLAAGAFDAWLARRGATTYVLRQERASANAAELALWLDEQQPVAAVHYPGLAVHEDRAIADRMLTNGFGSMLAVELDGARVDVDVFLAALPTVRLVHSLGGPATSLSHALTMSQRFLSNKRQQELGLHWGYFRISVGIEALPDLKAELAAAFSQGRL